MRIACSLRCRVGWGPFWGLLMAYAMKMLSFRALPWKCVGEGLRHGGVAYLVVANGRRLRSPRRGVGRPGSAKGGAFVQ
jgi:hypothetical protein